MPDRRILTGPTPRIATEGTLGHDGERCVWIGGTVSWTGPAAVEWEGACLHEDVVGRKDREERGRA